MLIGTSLISTLLGLVGILLGLSILVQVIQECWKYLLSTKGAAYQRALFAFLGPWARELLRPGVIPDLQINGPFQKWRRRPKGRLQQMDQSTLVAALERTAAPWIRRVLQALRAEADLQNGRGAALSPAFAAVLEQLRATGQDSPGYASAQEALRFLKKWSSDDTTQLSDTGARVDARKLITAFRQQFLPQITEVERTFTQLDRNFEYLYRRRNTALTFLFATSVVVALDAPIATLYRQAKGMTPEQAVTLGENARGVFDSLNRLPRASAPAARQADSVRADEYLRFSRDILEALRQSANVGTAVTAETDFLSARVNKLRQQIKDGGLRWAFGYLLGSLVTALLISFGAPFWNDVAGAVLRVSKGSRKVEIAPAQTGGDG